MTVRPAAKSRRALGQLFVFEGPDGVGKSTLAAAFTAALARGRPVELVSFPGSIPGTLGRLVYDIHHDPNRFGLGPIAPLSLQLLHVAAHLDTIDNLIIPLLEQGTTVVLDRFWWSTWVYGVVSGADREDLQRVIDVELIHWREETPRVLFLVNRPSALVTIPDRHRWQSLVDTYAHLAATEVARYPIAHLRNDRDIDAVVHDALLLAMARDKALV